MTGSDLIVLAPWVIFGAGLAIIWLRLRKSRRIARRASTPSSSSSPAGTRPPPPVSRP